MPMSAARSAGRTRNSASGTPLALSAASTSLMIQLAAAFGSPAARATDS
jgi:hypothetical protein